MKDLLSMCLVHCDILTGAVSSDATSDAADGVGIRFNGYQKAYAIGSIGAPADSDGTAVMRLQYATVSNVASDCSDSDYSSFSTDAVTASLSYASSDLAAGEGVGIIEVDLAAHGLSNGCVRTQVITAGDNASTASTWILLYGKSGIPDAQEHTVVKFP